MLIALFITNTCYISDHEEESASYPTEKDIGVRLFVTNNGLNQYSKKNVQLALANLDISSINFELDVFGFTISISESKFINIQFNNISFKMLDKIGRIEISDIDVEIFFALSIQQKTFPYLSDSGSLTISIRKLSFATNVVVSFPDPNCKQKFVLVRDHSSIHVSDFTFTFKCGLEIILNAISQFMTNVLRDQLNGALGQQIAGVVLDALLGILTKMNQYAPVKWGHKVWSDQRVINGVSIRENFFETYYTGQRMRNATGVFHGWLNDTIGAPVSFITSNDVQYQIEKIVFNSGFQSYLEDKRCTDGICIEDIRLERFHNTGAKVLVNISFDNKTETLIFLEPVVAKATYMGNQPSKEDDKYFINFCIRLTNMISGSLLLKDEQIANLSSYFATSFEIFDYAIDNIVGANHDSFIVIYLNEDWIHVGINF